MSEAPGSRKRRRTGSYKTAGVTVRRRPYAKAKRRRPYARSYGISSGIQKELKFFDTDLSFLIDLTGEVPATGQLCLIPQGDTESSRDGRAAYVKSIQIRGNFSLIPVASATASSTAYVYVVLDTQCNGAAAAVTDVLTGANLGTALINLTNSERFKIMKRFVIEMNAQAGVSTAYNNHTVPVDWYKKCDIPLQYNSTAGAITEIRSNNIFLLAGTNAAAGDDLINFTGRCRLRFYD